MLLDFIFYADKNESFYETSNWKIMKRCNRGCDPFFTLHKRVRVFKLSWWSGVVKFGKLTDLHKYIYKWDNFKY